jgi:hypothetical protein
MKPILSLLFLLISPYLQAQVTQAYEFLDLSPSARITALGGLQIAVVDKDLGLAAQNPALYNAQMHNQLLASHSLYLADIGHGYVGYARQIDTTHHITVGGGLNYVSYGNFDQADEFGNITGSFKAGEYALQLGGAWQHNNLSLGASLKFILSSLESYNSFGIATDLGATYHLPKQNYTFSLVLRNIGGQVTTYANTREPLPFDILLGASHRFTHLPFRISIMAHDLTRWNIRYPRNNNNNIIVLGADTTSKEKTYFVDNLFQHLNFNAELYLGKALCLRAGYNHQRKQAMALNSFRTMGGFSFGGGIRIKRIAIDYGRAIYHPSSSDNHFSFMFSF